MSFDLAELVSVPAGAPLEVGPDVAATGARETRSAPSSRAREVRYDAGADAPWTDACTVPVRVKGQEDWTYLSVPVRIEALDPVPELRPAVIVVGPGETVTFALRDMTSWQRAVQAAGSRTRSTSSARSSPATPTTASSPSRDRPRRAGGRGGRRHLVTSHAGRAARTADPPRRPRAERAAAGRHDAQQCSQAAGSSCEIPVIGAPGEVNPLPRTALELTSVRASGACVGIAFQVASPSSVLASWAPDAPGATCTAAFSVRDAQGRGTNAERDGTLLLDLQGYPRGPASLRQSDYGDGIVTLRVDPGEAQLAYPALLASSSVTTAPSSRRATPPGCAPRSPPRTARSAGTRRSRSTRSASPPHVRDDHRVGVRRPRRAA